MSARLVQLSKFLSLMLRHEPAKFGLVLDPEGFVPLADAMLAINRQFPQATSADVVAVVGTIEPDKQRFTIVEGDIRANYGHSLAERVAQAAMQPPQVLIHGTNERAVGTILRDGLRPMKRQYVHMTPDAALAELVGARRGKPVLISVDAHAAHLAGVVFYRANDSFWLADAIPASYLRLLPAGK